MKITPEKKQRIIAMAQQGFSTRAILKALDLTCQPKYIDVVICQARKGGQNIPFRREQSDGERRRACDIMILRLSAACQAQFDKAAARRGKTSKAIATAILETVANDKIIDAVLDDAAEITNSVPVASA